MPRTITIAAVAPSAFAMNSWSGQRLSMIT